MLLAGHCRPGLIQAAAPSRCRRPRILPHKSTTNDRRAPVSSLPRRAMLAMLAGAALLSAQSANAADAYPERPVTLIVPSAAGGTTDFTARLLAEGLTRELGKQFIVDNKGGASGNIGIGQAARA